MSPLVQCKSGMSFSLILGKYGILVQLFCHDFDRTDFTLFGWCVLANGRMWQERYSVIEDDPIHPIFIAERIRDHVHIERWVMRSAIVRDI